MKNRDSAPKALRCHTANSRSAQRKLVTYVLFDANYEDTEGEVHVESRSVTVLAAERADSSSNLVLKWVCGDQKPTGPFSTCQ